MLRFFPSIYRPCYLSRVISVQQNSDWSVLGVSVSTAHITFIYSRTSLQVARNICLVPYVTSPNWTTYFRLQWWRITKTLSSSPRVSKVYESTCPKYWWRVRTALSDDWKTDFEKSRFSFEINIFNSVCAVTKKRYNVAKYHLYIHWHEYHW